MELFAIPFAGGSEHCYRDLEKHFTAIRMTVQALPGRGKLISQPCITAIDEMVDYLFQELRERFNQPYALFGHSMGAFIACMLSRKIHHEGLPMPRALMLSGRKAPSIKEHEIKHTMPSAQFRTMLQELGGVPDAVWQDEDIMTLFEPILRADFELLETYQYHQQQALDVPFYLFLGEDDEISAEQAQAWQKETSQPLTITYFKGGHFYFQKDAGLLAEMISEKLISQLETTSDSDARYYLAE
ncbi:MAG: alpha/beta fold hydrolase [Gammaproteobacteria bacterium]|nr:alpha/beta fold hydrolase [Gammaproteobacteria bacterium]